MKRFYEIIPGFFCWTTLLTPFVLAIFWPMYLAYFIILYDLYWLYKTFVMGTHLILGYAHLRHGIEIDWMERLLELKNLDNYLFNLKKKIRYSRGFVKSKLKEEWEEISLLKEKEKILIDWQNLYQAVIFPTYKEEVDTLRASISACQKSLWPKERMIVVLGIEKREGFSGRKKAEILRKEFSNVFYKFLVTEHPENLKGEMKAKGANLTYAARQLQKFLDQEKIDYKNVIVSAFDSDTRPHPQYFACLAYKFIVNPNRLRRTFQPIPLYSNNIWEVTFLTRLVALSASFWQMIEATRPYRMINFSSQAMSMQTLVEIDFWDTNIVSEDSRQFFRAYFTYAGDHQVVPLFTPVYMDAIAGRNLWDTFRQQYLQKRRWAYGVEHFPYLCKELPRHKEIPLLSRLLVFWRQFEGHYSWATASLLLLTIGWLPFALSPVFRTTILAYKFPQLARYLLSLAWIGIVVSTFISLGLLPHKPKRYGFRKTLEIYLQWIFVPIPAIFFGSIPAIDAQTRLMLGKYLGFWVTPKIYHQSDAKQ